jgi:ketosteroid isomerase-like protein
VPNELMDRARAGLAAWQRGDLSALAEMLDPAVQLLWWEPGEWDCDGRDAVLALLIEISARGQSGGDVEFFEQADDRLIVSVAPTDRDTSAERHATLVTFAGGRVTRMQQYRTLDAALQATA